MEENRNINMRISPFRRVIPMIYAYSTPGVTYHDGWTKIGYTEKQTVNERIAQQTHTAGIQAKKLWQDNAMYKDGSAEYFKDLDFHNYLEVHRKVERQPKTEWFHVDGPTSREYFDDFADRNYDYDESEGSIYELREEQQDAVDMTKAYFENGGKEFLWNAKPRFGKTLTAYDLIVQMGFTKVLIVTNRPSISNSWAEDFNKFIGWRGKLCFVSDTDALKGKHGVLTRDEYIHSMGNWAEGEEKGMVAFESLQGLKGSKYFGGEYDKLEWMTKIDFDLLIVDEAQEGVDTFRTEQAFKYIKRKHTLYLSGTPFKALASEQFSSDQIFNWSYADEQEAKENWTGENSNPYESLPRMSLFTYQLSNMIYDKVQKGLDLSGEEDMVDYAFDLNEFFATTESGKFIHEDEIRKFLHVLCTGEKYPFSTPELRKELSHTLWILDRVASVKALAKLLKEDEIFKEYEIVIAAGDGRQDENDDSAAEAAFDRVKKAIDKHEKTITLSVGQLTVGVTIPKWSGVLMLCNMKSPSSYMQAAFRAQNPCSFTQDGQRFRKETSYVFDFDPARTLIIYDEFANNLKPETASGKGTSADQKENIRRLLNFFPVLGEDDEGQMVELNATQVLSIPRKLKCQEVVRHGFMSNFLFQNISNVFGAPGAVRKIIEKMPTAQEEKPAKKQDKEALDHMGDVSVDPEGNATVSNEIVIGKSQNLFGNKVYEDLNSKVQPQVNSVTENSSVSEVEKILDQTAKTLGDELTNKVVTPVAETYNVKKGTQKKMEKEVRQDINRKIEEMKGDIRHQESLAQAELDRKRQEAETPEEVQKAEEDFASAMKDAMNSLQNSLQETVKNAIDNKPQELVQKMEQQKAQAEKNQIEDTVRDHLRGFSRTIPSFIMAYGDGKLTLRNFDDYTEDDVFLEVTGISEDDFRFLRDGGDYTDPDTGEIEHFDGNLFNEVVFDDSIEEFWHKKQELSNYFDESQDEDIFDYIPPQKTNQIFTPKWVVQKMVDELEQENPGCFDDPDNTFADLYMKSGLYITEIVKRLYRSEKMKELIPDNKERIRHILEKQVYGMAPTRIIYLISTNYILGFDEEMKSVNTHFVQADAAEAAKNGTLEELVNSCFQ